MPALLMLVQGRVDLASERGLESDCLGRSGLPEVSGQIPYFAEEGISKSEQGIIRRIRDCSMKIRETRSAHSLSGELADFSWSQQFATYRHNQAVHRFRWHFCMDNNGAFLFALN